VFKQMSRLKLIFDIADLPFCRMARQEITPLAREAAEIVFGHQRQAPVVLWMAAEFLEQLDLTDDQLEASAEVAEVCYDLWQSRRSVL